MLEAGGCNAFIISDTRRADHEAALFLLAAVLASSPARYTQHKKIMHFLCYGLPHRPSSAFTGPSTLKTICGAGEPKRQLATEKFFGCISVPFEYGTKTAATRL